MKELLRELLLVFVPVFGAFLMYLAKLVVNKLMDKLDAETKILDTEAGEAKKRIIRHGVSDIVEGAIDEVQQVFVSTYKKEGKWDKEKSQEALEMAAERILKRVDYETSEMMLELTGHKTVKEAALALIERKIAEKKALINP
jgi:acetolactate synthase small subunit